MSEKENSAERIWVGVRQGAEITGYHVDQLRQFAISALEQSPEERPLKVRFRSKRYEFWLPDLLSYIKSSPDPFPIQDAEVEPIWVMTAEAAEATGYNADYVGQLARKMWQQPEADRIIKVRLRSARYELWLPDLMYYIKNIGIGPEPGRSSKT